MRQIKKGDLVLIQEGYGEDQDWYEVIDVQGDVITCTNGNGENFETDINNIVDVGNPSELDQIF